MEVIFTEHALDRIKERGTDVDEVREVLTIGHSVEAKTGRNAKELIFEYNCEWLGKYYKQKKVRVIFVEEDNYAIVITAYVYFGYWR